MTKGKELVLIHGWDPRFYTNNLHLDKNIEGLAWSNREKLLDLLKNRFDVKFFNLPGFCGKKEPLKEFYDIEDFSSDFNKWLSDKNIAPLVIIGYSFGGAVALNYKLNYKADVPLILISPALSRKESLFSVLGNSSKKLIPDIAKNSLKNIYQYVFSKYYRLGSPFIRESYDHIVRRDISKDLEKINGEDILLIYGTKDSSTPWTEVENIVKNMGINHVLIDGGHNIGETNGIDIFNAIVNFIK